jgi:hypothetical protein
MAASNSRRHLFAKQYHHHVNAWLESGLSQSAFCQMHQLPLSTFNKWVSRIQGPSKLSLAKLSKQKTMAEKSQLTLLPVQITSLPTPQPRPGASLILSSPSGWQLQLQDLPSVQWLQALMQNTPSKESFK